MKFAYLIATHQAPDQLEALLDRLLPPETPDIAVLHLDAKSALWLSQRERFAHHKSGRVFIVERPVKVFWGHHSQLEATLRMLDVALANGFDLAHHISGSDWPVKTRAQIIADYDNERRPAHIDIVGPAQQDRMQNWWFDGLPLAPTSRFLRVRGRLRRERTQFSLRASDLLRSVGIKRSEPYGSPWLKGWSWWSFPNDVVERVRSELRLTLDTGRLRLTKCPDEHVIPTIVAAHFADRLAPYRRYIEWSDNASNPNILTQRNLDAIVASDAWFARKLDASVDDFFLSAFPPFDRS
jgi:Core-2/I-Branching enzyme